LHKQIEQGEALAASEVLTAEQLASAKDSRRAWMDYTKEVLVRIYSDESLKVGFRTAVALGSWNSLRQEKQVLLNSVRGGVKNLRSVQDRLELFPEPEAMRDQQPSSGRSFTSQVFVVHGHDDGLKSQVARLVEQLGLEAVVLHERPNQGRTIIEKFEAHSAVGYAVVLMTPDDVGAPAAKPNELRPRARQNVVFELGYFVGALSRNKVCVLIADGVELEIHSDFSGVLRIPLDKGGAWRFALANEMKAAGLPVDLNKL
jgi:predicted nucleotide-binding protein